MRTAGIGNGKERREEEERIRRENEERRELKEGTKRKNLKRQEVKRARKGKETIIMRKGGGEN